MNGALVMSTRSLDEFVVFTVYPVVTVTVNHRQVVIPVVVVVAIPVMNLDQRLRHEHQPTGLAASLLRLQQLRHPVR